MSEDNELDYGEAMDIHYSKRVENEVGTQRDLRKLFLDGVPAKAILFWNIGYVPIEGYLNGECFIYVEPDINEESGRLFRAFHVTDVNGLLAICGTQQILGQVVKKVN